MIPRVIVGGIRAALRRPGLVLLLWAWHTALALVVTLPFWSRLRAATATSPETDALMGGLQLGTLLELLQQHGAVVPALVATALALAGVALLSNAFLAGGILEVLVTSADERPLLHRFFRGAGHFFFRSLRLLAVTLVVFAVLAGLAAAGLSAALRPLTSGGWEPGSLLSGAVVLAAVAAIGGACLLTLDYARVVLVIGDRRKMIATWFRAARFVLAHPLVTGIIGVVFGGLVLATLALGAWAGSRIGGLGWGAIATALVVQQALVFARVAARVAQLAAESDVCRLVLPAALLEPIPAPPPEPLAPAAAAPAEGGQG